MTARRGRIRIGGGIAQRRERERTFIRFATFVKSSAPPRSSSDFLTTGDAKVFTEVKQATARTDARGIE
jgi:hypothetical protein